MKTVTSKLLTWLIPLILILAFIYLLVFNAVRKSDLEQHHFLEIQKIVSAYSVALKYPVWSFDEETISFLVETLSSVQDISCVILNDIKIQKQWSSVKVDCDLSAYKVIKFPIQHEGKDVAILSVFFTHQSVLAELKSELYRSIILVVGLLVILLLGSLIAQKILVGRPLKKLLHSIHQASIYDVITKIEWRSKDEFGQIVRAFNTLIDKYHHSESQLKESRDLLLTNSHIINNMFEGALLVDEKTSKILYTNPFFNQMFGYEEGELLSQHMSVLNDATTIDPKLVSLEIETQLGKHGAWSGEVHNVKKDGTPFWCSVNITTFKHPLYGDVWISTNTDMSERKEAENKLSYQASHDALTGLINRNEFEIQTNHLLDTAIKNKAKHALCFLDLDQFKIINDTCGHAAGDELLRQLAVLLQKAVRQQDSLARLGGDEFGVLLEYCSLEQAERVANIILNTVRDFNFYWEERSYRIGVSIGLVAISETTLNFTTLLQQADIACYMAKELGRNRIHLYRPEDNELSARYGEMQWVNRIIESIENDRLCLYAQPIVALDDSSKIHYELLIRMIGEEGEIIPPGAFLPAAERYNLMGKIDEWVVDYAFRLLSENPDLLKQVSFISINLSGPSLTNQQFLDDIISMFKSYDIDTKKICFEVTETVAISNLNAASNFINKLKAIDCSFALDDFGSGLSSFAYLKNLPVDYLKIDGMFVRDIVDDPIDHAMVKSINEIGQVIGVKTIAEFVENDEIKVKLKELGVNYGQGYGLGKPEPFIDLLNQVRKEIGIA